MAKKKKPEAAADIPPKNIQDWQKNLATALGAVNFILLDGAGDVSDTQRKFLLVARKNLQQLFNDFQERLKESGEK